MTLFPFNLLRERAFNLRWAQQPANVIPLTAADPDFPICPGIQEELIRHVNDGVMSYVPPEGLPAFATSGCYLAPKTCFRPRNRIFALLPKISRGRLAAPAPRLSFSNPKPIHVVPLLRSSPGGPSHVPFSSSPVLPLDDVYWKVFDLEHAKGDRDANRK